MQILDLVLSFALLMIAFSTIASGITELILRLLNARANNLRDAIKSFSEDILLPSADRLLGRSTPQSDTDRTQLLETVSDALTRNPVHARSVHLVLGRLNLPSTRVIDALSSEGFVQRLAQTPVGAVIAAQSPADRAAVLNEIMLAFERYMATSSELFRKYANVTALIVAVIFSGAANIQLGPLISHLRDNPAVAAQIIAEKDVFVAMVENQPEFDDDTEKALAQISDHLADLRDSYQLPIGWGQNAPEAGTGGPVAIALWLGNVLAAGLLIGLGAPFWYRIVQKISQIRMIAGAVTGRSDEMVASAGATAASSNDPIARLKAFVDLFEASSQTNRVPKVDDVPAPAG